MLRMPRIRVEPEDFEVEELPLYEPSGDGPHLYLLVEKRLRNTADVVRDLAAALDLPRRSVGYAGRKDRRAVTRQWLSVPERVAERLDDLGIEGARILDVTRHREQLRVGQLLGNRFRLVVREVGESEGRRAAGVLERLAERGMPNRFGQQRFGRDGRNADRGREILASPRLRGDRRRAWLMVSALQSAVFNRVLELRPHDRLLAGDLAIVHGTGALLSVPDPASAEERLARFELSPTGPIFGTKVRSPRGEASVVEERAMVELGAPPPGELRPPRGLRLFGDRRPLRVRPEKVAWELREDALEIRFDLPAGSYATVLLDQLFPDGVEEG